MSDQDTIYALSSGAGRAGIAVIRVSGPDAGVAVVQLTGSECVERVASFRKLRHPEDSETLDEALVFWFPGPRSFTGENVCEFHVHGGIACVSAVLGVLSTLAGFRSAEPGEFTRRAFHNGRLDLTQVEGLADLIDAETQAQRRQSLRQMDGYLGRQCAVWGDELLHSLAYFEAEIDFPDEQDVPADVAQGLRDRLEVLVKGIRSELAVSRGSERLRDGLRVVIAGAPNVGKSSLLNLLAGRDAAIVSARAGTTRDAIEVHLELGGYPVILIDTAGVRDTDDDVEREGVVRALRYVETADVVVWVCDATLPDGEDVTPGGFDSPALRVMNKMDLVGEAPDVLIGDEETIRVSVETGQGIDALLMELASLADTTFGGGETALVTRERHRKGLEACCGHIDEALLAMGSGAEIVAEHLRRAGHDLGRVTGQFGVEDLLDVIFRDFCIGK